MVKKIKFCAQCGAELEPAWYTTGPNSWDCLACPNFPNGRFGDSRHTVVHRSSIDVTSFNVYTGERNPTRLTRKLWGGWFEY